MGDQRKIILWKTPDVRLSAWFLRYDWKAQLEIRSANLFENKVDGLSEIQVDQTTVTISSPERVVLEYMHDVPQKRRGERGGLLHGRAVPVAAR
jgi:hypothetical protein